MSCLVRLGGAVAVAVLLAVPGAGAEPQAVAAGA